MSGVNYTLLTYKNRKKIYHISLVKNTYVYLISKEDKSPFYPSPPQRCEDVLSLVSKFHISLFFDKPMSKL